MPAHVHIRAEAATKGQILSKALTGAKGLTCEDVSSSEGIPDSLATVAVVLAQGVGHEDWLIVPGLPAFLHGWQRHAQHVPFGDLPVRKVRDRILQRLHKHTLCDCSPQMPGLQDLCDVWVGV